MMENKTKIDLKNKSVFITGVAGFIGSNLAKRLLSTVEGVKVVGLDNMNHYYDTEVIFQKKTLIIGANDVGKSNLLYALRILFDKTISEHDLELTESDYNAYSGTDTIEITAYLCEVTEDCLLSTFGSAVKDGKVVIRYTNQKNGTYKILTGYDVSTLSELQTRQYIKRLNMQYVDTNRNLFSFLSREKSKILQIAKEKLSEEATASDSQKINEIQNDLDKINESISSLQYISTSLAQVNRELGELSVHNEDQTVRFVAGESKADKMLDNLVLAYSTGDTPLSIGGDKIKELAGLVYAQKETKVALNNLHSVISDPHQLKNYVPARENELNIMTLHKSKGLEFNIVFHMDMYKWIIPNEFGDESSVQQDLNLHYVGLTRAKDACYIMNGTARFRNKKNDYIFAEPSLFLSKPGLAERRKDVRWEM